MPMLDQMLAALTSSDSAQRYEAATRLSDYGDPEIYTSEARQRALEALIAALPDADSKVQYAVFSTLVKLDAREAFVPMLDMLLAQPESRVWGLLKLTVGMRLRNALLNMTPAGDPAMADRLNSASTEDCFDEQQQALLVRLLGKTGDTRYVEPLIDLLLHGDIIAQGAAAEALGSIGDARAISPLMLFLNEEEDERVREIAVTALGRIGEKQHGLSGDAQAADAKEKIYEPLATLLTDSSEWVRGAAATALADLGDRRAVEPLSALLEDESAMVADAAFDALKRFSYEKLNLNVNNDGGRRFISYDN